MSNIQEAVHNGSKDCGCYTYQPEEAASLVFLCPGCNRYCAPCFGCADDMPDHCDDCWVKAHPEEEDWFDQYRRG